MPIPGWLASAFAAATLLTLACAGSQPLPQPAPTLESTAEATAAGVADELPTEIDWDDTPAPAWIEDGWKTDFSKHSVSYKEILALSPSRDRIAPLDNPRFTASGEDAAHLERDTPVLSVEIAGDARAYPLDMLMYHEVVNDVVGGTPVTITYCPLCNSAAVYERTVQGRTLEFSITGMLRHSGMVMWDLQTQTWWQQLTGEAIAGELTGTTLPWVPANIVSWSRYKKEFPSGRLLSREQSGIDFDYDAPLYAGYDQGLGVYFPSRGFTDSRVPYMERVVGLVIDGQAVAYPLTALADRSVLEDTVAGQGVAVFFEAGALSPFPGLGTGGSLVPGSATAFASQVQGRSLTFDVVDGQITDRETGSLWSPLGTALAGPLEGQKLTPLSRGSYFWFAWAAFYPETRIVGLPGTE